MALSTTNPDEISQKSVTRDYIIEIKTSDKWLAGTDDDVFVKIDGNGTSSDWIKIDNKWKNDFERGNVDRFNLTCHNLGTFTFVVIELTLFLIL